MIKKFLVTAITIFATAALGQTTQEVVPQGPADLIVKVSTLKGTYAQFFQQIANVCQKPSLAMSESSGTVAALNDILTNQANVIFLTADVLYGKKIVENDNSVDRLRVIMPLYISELHPVALRSNGELQTFSQVANKKVATYGGAYITARVLFATGNIRPISLQDYTSEAAALEALDQGKADVALISAGQPTTWAKALNGNKYKLLEFDRPDLLGRNGYVSANLRYPNLSQTAVKSLGVQVFLVTQDYKSDKKVRDISELKNCITRHISDLRENTGNHPKWYEVKPNAKTEWPMFQTVGSVEPKRTKK